MIETTYDDLQQVKNNRQKNIEQKTGNMDMQLLLDQLAGW